MQNTEQNREIVAEVIASEYTEDELRGIVVNDIMSDIKADQELFERYVDRNPEMCILVRTAARVLNITVREAVIEHDTSSANLQRMIREEKKKRIPLGGK
tara:strand:- start:839 stop:1138 length:300 start_codon:yes stop_codon:yes gene_type:complete